jgi:tRNA-dihydrouridine synthase A
VRAMVDAADGKPVTIKHRIGIDRTESYGFVRDFVGTVADAGCGVFIVHARNAWLQGVSPKQNRELPPLRYGFVHRLKQEFPALTIVLNGGVRSDDEISEQLRHVDGVMIGRHAYHEPWTLAGWDQRFFGVDGSPATREQVEAAWISHLEVLHAAGTPWPHAMRHALGLWNGVPGARRWRQAWSDHRLKDRPPHEVQAMATASRSTHVPVEEPV